MENGIVTKKENAVAINKLLESLKLPWQFVYAFSEVKEKYNKTMEDYKKAYNVIMYKYGKLQEENADKVDAKGNKYKELTVTQIEAKETETEELHCRSIDILFPTVPLHVFETIYKEDKEEIKKLKKESKEIDMSKYMTANDMLCYISLGIAVGEPDKDSLD